MYYFGVYCKKLSYCAISVLNSVAPEILSLTCSTIRVMQLCSCYYLVSLFWWRNSDCLGLYLCMSKWILDRGKLFNKRLIVNKMSPVVFNVLFLFWFVFADILREKLTSVPNYVPIFKGAGKLFKYFNEKKTSFKEGYKKQFLYNLEWVQTFNKKYFSKRQSQNANVKVRELNGLATFACIQSEIKHSKKKKSVR